METKNLKPPAAVHYSRFRQLRFQEVQMSTLDSAGIYTTTVSFGRFKGLNNVKIEFRAWPGDDSSRVRIVKNDQLLKEFILPFIVYYMDTVAYVGDINNDGKPDIKFVAPIGANGIGAEIVSNIYLFNLGNTFRVISFNDFWTGKEYDLDNDGDYEFVVTTHTFYGEHSYWVHDVFSYTGGKMVNQSKKFGYPLWTRHLNTTNNVIARYIPNKQKVQNYQSVPPGLIIK